MYPSENVCGQEACLCGCKLVVTKTTKNVCGQGTDNCIVRLLRVHQKMFVVRKRVNKKKTEFVCGQGARGQPPEFRRSKEPVPENEGGSHTTKLGSLGLPVHHLSLGLTGQGNKLNTTHWMPWPVRASKLKLFFLNTRHCGG